MNDTLLISSEEMKVSDLAEHITGSEIIKLAGEINEKLRKGEKIYNLTIGDFNPNLFPLPEELKKYIIEAYINNETNYPPADGVLTLRESVSSFLKKRQGVNYAANNILIAGGARPLIYAAYQVLVNPGEYVLFPVPSWNNNHYTYLTHAKQLFIETKPEHNFMPTADELKPHIQQAGLVALCSPLNPTGTTFTKKDLKEICQLILEENDRRSHNNQKPLYLLYDQVYWTLTFGDTQHHDPVSLYPEMKPFTIFIDGLSKAFAATGIRVGWAFGPTKIMDKMKSILGHVGAWSPKAEQVATAIYLKQDQQVESYQAWLKSEIHKRLKAFYDGFMDLKKEGFPVDAIAPQAAIYLTVQLNLIGKRTSSGSIIKKTTDITNYILNDAKIAMVPFAAFGASTNSTWYRISVGACKLEEISAIMESLKNSLKKLS